jgi:hypothetical protein
MSVRGSKLLRVTCHSSSERQISYEALGLNNQALKINLDLLIRNAFGICCHGYHKQKVTSSQPAYCFHEGKFLTINEITQPTKAGAFKTRTIKLNEVLKRKNCC